MNISISRIIKASICILNEEGIGSLTMRKIAAKLNIAAPSLYFHVKDKLELYGFITEYICEVILRQISPKNTLQEICFILRKEYKAVHDSPQLFIKSPPSTKDRITLINIFLAKLRKSGVAGKHLTAAANLLNNYILSFVIDEETWDNKEKGIVDIPFKLDTHNADKQFKFGLQVILKGLRSFGRQK